MGLFKATTSAGGTTSLNGPTERRTPAPSLALQLPRLISTSSMLNPRASRRYVHSKASLLACAEIARAVQSNGRCSTMHAMASWHRVVRRPAMASQSTCVSSNTHACSYPDAAAQLYTTQSKAQTRIPFLSLRPSCVQKYDSFSNMLLRVPPSA